MPIFINRLGHSLVPCRAATLLGALIMIAIVSSCGRSEISLNRKIDTAFLMHNLSEIKGLVHDNPNLIYHRDETGETLLHLAASFSEADVAEFLLANKAEVNAKDNRFTTPLDGARNKDVAELLLAKGADVNATSEGDMTPLDWALFNRNKEVAEFLREHGGK